MQYCNDIYQQLFCCFSCGLKAAHFMLSGLGFLLILQSGGGEGGWRRINKECQERSSLTIFFLILKGSNNANIAPFSVCVLLCVYLHTLKSQESQKKKKTHIVKEINFSVWL